jgi:hypothetical protein
MSEKVSKVSMDRVEFSDLCQYPDQQRKVVIRERLGTSRSSGHRLLHSLFEKVAGVRTTGTHSMPAVPGCLDL